MTMNRYLVRLLYYLVFYNVTVGLTVGYLYWYLYFQVPLNYPALTGMQSTMKMNPGLSYLPHPDMYSSVVVFRPRETLNYFRIVDEQAAFLHRYRYSSNMGMLRDCALENEFQQDQNRPCRYYLDAAGPCGARTRFGSDFICVILKMNRIFGWLPDPVDYGTGVLVKCSGATEDDTFNLGNITYYDIDYRFTSAQMQVGKVENGSFNKIYFPYRSQSGYQQPLVFVKFENVAKHTFIRVKCWLIAKNINVDFARNEGSTQFEILVE